MNADYALIRKAKNGDLHSADLIIRKYYADIFKYCRYHSMDIHTAEDLTQDTFLSFFAVLQNYKHEGKLLNYLYTIAKNKCSDEMKRKRNTDICIEYINGELFSDVNQVEKYDEHIVVEEALKELPNELREVIVFYYFMDKKQKEIADICNIGVPLVKYRINQGKKEMKKYLERRNL